ARELELDADHIRRERAQRFLEQLLAGFVAFEQDDSVRIHGASVGGFGGPAAQPAFRQTLLGSGITAVLRRTTGLNMARRGGWRRVGSRRRFRYIDSRGRPIQDDEALERIASLAIPPAWKKVWISPSPTAKLQAT